RLRGLLCMSAVLALASSSTASASFLGLENGDVIDRIGFTINSGGAVFTDTAAATGDSLAITASADDITTTTPEVLTDINTGMIDITLSVDSETIVYLGSGGGFDFFTYTAIFSGDGVDPVKIYAPTGGPAPEQDGRLLVSGAFVTSPNPSLSITFSTNPFGTPTFTFTGTFDVTGGDSTFLQAFGNTGELADVIAASTSSIPSLAGLMTDGHLFSQRDDGMGGNLLLSCAGGGTCTGTITGQQSWNASGTGEIRPQNAAPFVPEPGTFLMVSIGLIGLGLRNRP
ncbi:MAG: PEP-CTERM sorting domain-containing protein, partial [Myxococcota bacterium]|nr:PEP-CTERM sorting domain-containing protein [Myxococcota bacterium]